METKSFAAGLVAWLVEFIWTLQTQKLRSIQGQRGVGWAHNTEETCRKLRDLECRMSDDGKLMCQSSVLETYVHTKYFGRHCGWQGGGLIFKEHAGVIGAVLENVQSSVSHGSSALFNTAVADVVYFNNCKLHMHGSIFLRYISSLIVAPLQKSMKMENGNLLHVPVCVCVCAPVQKSETVGKWVGDRCHPTHLGVGGWGRSRAPVR